MAPVSSNLVANGNMRDSNSAPRVVDLRSDTVTKPTDAMRAAMAKADVDDDVLGSDPTADQLQHQVAKLMGKEAGLFVASGTMGNLISVLVHCEVRGSEVILGSDSHIYVYENGGISTIGHVHPRVVPNKEDGTMDLRQIEASIRPAAEELYYPTTRLVCLENTHNAQLKEQTSKLLTSVFSPQTKWDILENLSTTTYHYLFEYEADPMQIP